ncbi:MAG: hypothetical protein HKM89_10745 [Gemmatimonadales bacterium]|nr:hypothetical protein [Gemmatimonadales bacterium]
MFERRIPRMGLLALIAGLAACSSEPNSDPVVSFNLATRSAAPAVAAYGRPSFEIYTLGSTTIDFTSVRVAFSEIELERAESTIECDVATIDDDDCEEIELAPRILDLPLAPGASRTISVSVSPGTYDEIEFRVEKLGDESDESALVAANPEFDGVSVRVEGTYDDGSGPVPFVFTNDLDVEQELDLATPLTVDATGGADLTLYVDIGTWFLNQAGDGYVDPAQANKGGQHESDVKDNIKQSFDAFEDDDHDGQSDDS